VCKRFPLFHLVLLLARFISLRSLPAFQLSLFFIIIIRRGEKSRGRKEAKDEDELEEYNHDDCWSIHHN
jgi:hypothetical protein